MTEPKRLPVVYCVFSPIEMRLIRSSTSPTRTSLGRSVVVEYVPKAPTCATCKSWIPKATKGTGMLCAEDLGSKAGAKPMPRDGSGFCHNHDAKGQVITEPLLDALGFTDEATAATPLRQAIELAMLEAVTEFSAGKPSQQMEREFDRIAAKAAAKIAPDPRLAQLDDDVFDVAKRLAQLDEVRRIWDEWSNDSATAQVGAMHYLQRIGAALSGDNEASK